MSSYRQTQTRRDQHDDALTQQNRDAMASRTAAATAAMAAGYAVKEDEPDLQELKQRASSYNPDKDAEVDRLKAMPDDFLTANMRMSIGLHESAKHATQQLAKLGASRIIDED